MFNCDQVVCLILTVFGSFVLTQEDRHLQSVIVLFRHGDRTPISFYPNDPYKDRSNWPVGFGQLTSRGKMMHYKLGKYLRNRYKNLLSDTYDENDIYIRASDVDRTMMSAMSNLAGLYPPKGDQIWNPQLLWQPIPVHTVPQDYDRIIGGHAKCPKMKKLEEAVNDDPKIRSIIKKNEWVFKYLTQHTGMNVSTLQKIDYVYDTLFIEENYNKTLPSWTSKVYPEHMRDMRDLSFTMGTWNLELKRLKGGPLVQVILDHFKEFITGERSYKFVMFSGHDTTVATLLNTLGMFDPPKAPPYASMVIMELTSMNRKYFVNFAFRNETTHDPYRLTLPNCDYFCPIEKFEELTKHLRPQDWVEECDLHVDSTTETVTAVSAAIAIAMSVTLIIAVIISIVRRCTLKPKYQYFSIDQN